LATRNFAELVADAAALSPAERRVARYFLHNREEVLVASASVLAEKTKTSDATVVRTAKALGFSGLDELRRALADEIRSALSPAERLSRTLGAVGDSLPAAFALALDIQGHAIEGLRRSITDEMFQCAVDGIINARRIAVFGLGPSSAIAGYLAIQLNRFGFDTVTLSHTGLLFADDLQKLREGDLVIMLAYGQVYAELTALLDEIHRRKLRSFLITDSLATTLRRRVELVLPVERGQADRLSMHTATLGFLEAVLIGIATRRPEQTLGALRKLNEARAKLAGRPMNLPVSG
jgi:DNA-binding MurR/RpiR family transcriptional regulator